MKKESTLHLVQSIMDQFALFTGLSPLQESPRRYLWTDAFAVCNFLTLYMQTQDEKYKDLALQLVDQVHNVLGRHRADDQRTGWISGLSNERGRSHPTACGLRIGKALNERQPDDPVDERREWEQDGQYFHYLTKWMQALSLVSAVTGNFIYNRWALELAKTAHAHFTYSPSRGGRRRLYWKMSIDLSYPLVTSMGQHDPLDGLITYYQLQARAACDQETEGIHALKEEIGDMGCICEGKDWRTDDQLGLGGLLSDAYRAAQLTLKRREIPIDLLPIILDAALPGLQSCADENFVSFPTPYRLAFRELGLAIGLQAADKLEKLMYTNPNIFPRQREISSALAAVRLYAPLGEAITSFWMQKENQSARTWIDHRDINMVMLATSLAPDGYLTI